MLLLCVFAEMSEWSNVPVSKTGEQKCSGGSNPPLCAKQMPKGIFLCRGEDSHEVFRLSAPKAIAKAMVFLMSKNICKGF